jgi:hypothetical protein
LTLPIVGEKWLPTIVIDPNSFHDLIQDRTEAN